MRLIDLIEIGTEVTHAVEECGELSDVGDTASLPPVYVTIHGKRIELELTAKVVVAK